MNENRIADEVPLVLAIRESDYQYRKGTLSDLQRRYHHLPPRQVADNYTWRLLTTDALAIVAFVFFFLGFPLTLLAWVLYLPQALKWNVLYPFP